MRTWVLILILITGFTQLNGSREQHEINLAKIGQAYTEKLAEIKEYNRRNDIINAIILVESNNDPLAFNLREEAAGCLQIRPIMVREVNRLVGYEKYKYEDRWDKEKSIAMFIDYQNKVNPEWDAKIAARKWNGGYYGDLKPSTIPYWYKVKMKLCQV